MLTSEAITPRNTLKTGEMILPGTNSNPANFEFRVRRCINLTNLAADMRTEFFHRSHEFGVRKGFQCMLREWTTDIIY